MISPGDIAAVLEGIANDPAILGLGDLAVEHSSCLPGSATLRLCDVANFDRYVLDLQAGAVDDWQVVRLVESWAAERRRRAGRRCFAVLVAGEIPSRYVNLLAVVRRAVPITALELRISEVVGQAAIRFSPVQLR